MSWKKVGGSGIWTEWENTDTGEKSIQEHEPKVVQTWCAKDHHDFKIKDVGKRTAVCTKCDQETSFIVGKDKIDGDKVIIG